MGKLLDILTRESEDLSNCSFIITYLIESGFTYEKFEAGDTKGYQKMFYVPKDLACVYVHLDFKRGILSIYKVYERLNMSKDWENYQNDIPRSYIDNDNIYQFLMWLDRECEQFL